MKTEHKYDIREYSIAPSPMARVEAEGLTSIVRPSRPIPIWQTLTGRQLVMEVGNLGVVLTEQQARRLAHALLLEVESLIDCSSV